MNLNEVTKEELFELLGWAVDGIDGYQSENGSLYPYWNGEKINKARVLIERATGGVPFWKAMEASKSRTPR